MSEQSGTDAPPKKRSVVVMLAFKFSEGIKNLPAIGEMVPEEADVTFSDLRVIASSSDLTEKQIADVNGAIGTNRSPDQPVSRLPAAVSKGATLNVDIGLPGQPSMPLTLSVGGKPRKKPKGPKDPVALPQSDQPEEAAATSGSLPAPVQAGAWLKIDKSLGPVNLKRIGAAYQDKRLWFLFDAAVGAGGITVSADGLGLGTDLSALRDGTFDVQPTLSGLGLDYKQPPVEIGGAFLNKTAPPYSLYVAGAAVISTPAFGAQAVGAYQKKTDSDPSLFLLAAVNGNLPGNPSFQPKGIVAGFGYNSHLRVPEIAEVERFPLLAMLPGTDTENARIPHDPMTTLETLISGDHPWITGQEGTIWLAAGLAFSSFELLDARTVAVVEFGRDISVSLAGTAAAQLPPQGTPYANLELEVSASYSTAGGLLAFDGQLTPNSFVIDRNARLRGGFAVRSWLAGPDHEGDFTLTLGGYHPQYNKPSHYPNVDRLGLDWDPGGGVTVNAGSYLALTPDSLMAGGTLDIRYHAGPLRAWLNAHYDAIIQWAPFHFDLDIGVTLGASLDCWLFTLSGEVGAVLNLWGSPTGGLLTAHVVGVGVTVSFGAGKEAAEQTLPWNAFREQLLPTTPLTLTAPTGAGPLDNDDPRTPWSFSFETFQIRAATAVPATSAAILRQNVTSHEGRMLDIRPMGRSDLSSHLVLDIEQHNGGTAWDPVPDSHYRYETEYTPVPNALWGAPEKTGELADPSEQTAHGYITGAVISPARPDNTGIQRTIASANLAVNPVEPDGTNPLGQPAPAHYTYVDDPEAIRTIQRTLADKQAERSTLHDLLTNLGFALDSNDPMTRMAENAAELFTARPQNAQEAAA